MEIFGFPVIFIVIIVIILVVQHYEQKEKAAKKWDAINTQMSKNEVIERLGKPHRVWQAGVAEIWCYGSKDSDGQIKFHNDKVIAYEKPG